MWKTLTRLVVLAALMAAAPTSAWAGCPSTGATLLTTASQATAGFEDRDAAKVESSVAQLRSDLLCASTVLDPVQAAAVHRAFALQAFLSGNSDQTRLAFQAARAADPAYQLPRDFVSDGHPLRQAFDAAATPATPATEPLGQRAGQRTWVDGREAAGRPTDRPALIQADMSSGVMVGSAYLLPGDPLPGWASPPPATAQATEPAEPAAPTELAEPSSTTLATAQSTEQLAEDRKQKKEKDRSARKGPSKGLLWTGVGMGVASAGLWGVTVMDGMSYESRLEDALDGDYRTPDDIDQAQGEIDTHYQRVNALGYAAQATSATAGVLLVAAFVF